MIKFWCLFHDKNVVFEKNKDGIESPPLFLTRLQTEQDVSKQTAVLNNYFYIDPPNIEIVFLTQYHVENHPFYLPHAFHCY